METLNAIEAEVRILELQVEYERTVREAAEAQLDALRATLAGIRARRERNLSSALSSAPKVR